MKKAIDIVLLLSNEMMNFTISLNKPWVQGIDDEIALNNNSCLPHITLAMGVIKDSQLENIKKIMQRIAKDFSPLQLSIIDTHASTRSDGRNMSSLTVEKSPELFSLHEAVMDKLVPMFTYDDVTTDMFFSPPPVVTLPLWWVKDFVRTSVRENYNPHITLGMGMPENLKLPISFTASRFAVCQLGNYCTCRKILTEVSL